MLQGADAGQRFSFAFGRTSQGDWADWGGMGSCFGDVVPNASAAMPARAAPDKTMEACIIAVL